MLTCWKVNHSKVVTDNCGLVCVPFKVTYYVFQINRGLMGEKNLNGRWKLKEPLRPKRQTCVVWHAFYSPCPQTIHRSIKATWGLFLFKSLLVAHLNGTCTFLLFSSYMKLDCKLFQWFRLPYWANARSLLVSAIFVNSFRSGWKTGRTTRGLRAWTSPQLSV